MTARTCFVCMPISDIEGYDPGHFFRVYDYIIKPVCEELGLEYTRADDVFKTNYIIIDILRRLVDAALMICDLSGKNANVMYELGIRHSFNKKTVLLKDRRTDKVFDIQGLRFVEYDSSLRIDSVLKTKDDLKRTITETIDQQADDVNSIVQLMGIEKASVSKKQIGNESLLILNAIEDLREKITRGSRVLDENGIYAMLRKYLTDKGMEKGWTYLLEGKSFGEVVDIHFDSAYLKQPDGKIVQRRFTKMIEDKGEFVPF